jgi:hypothetical protein
MFTIPRHGRFLHGQVSHMFIPCRCVSQFGLQGPTSSATISGGRF